MCKKYKIPLALFVIYENVDPKIFTSSTMYDNAYSIVVDNNYVKTFAYCIKNELHMSKSFLLEHSAIDLSEYTDIFNEIEFFFKKLKFFCFYVIALLKLKISINLISLVNNNCQSIDNIYFNAN